MVTPVTLPRLSWGDPRAPARALLVHGLGSNGALMWRFGVALADAGWRASAVDLRGHGTAPRALDYTLAAYAADVAIAHPDDDEPWDLVIGHSLGGAAVTLAAADNPTWTRRLVLIDPGLRITDGERGAVRSSQDEAFMDVTVDDVRRNNPRWHEQDLELKALSSRQVSRWAVAETDIQNPDWDARAAAAALRIPTNIIGADPAVFSIFTGDLAAEVCTNPHITMSVVENAGHSPHRDRPDETLRQLFAAL